MAISLSSTSFTRCLPAFLLVVWMTLCGLATPARAAETVSLAQQAISIIEERCASCHDGQGHPLDALDRVSLTQLRDNGQPAFIHPGDPEKSYLWTLVSADVMPKGDDKLDESEKAILKNWILEGANFPDYGGGGRHYISELEILQSIQSHLSLAKIEDREYLRYFSLHVLVNNRELTDDKIRLAVAALAKAINSLSRKRSIVEITPIDTNQTVFAVNIRDLGWDENQFQKWQKVLAAYPYGIKPIRGDEQRLFTNIQDLYQSRGFFDGYPYIRADWFIATALRPPLYHELLETPTSLAELEKQEGFDRHSDFLRNQMLRGGVLLSGISYQPRILDYHEAERGIWISNDFLTQPQNDPERGNIIRYPLGPNFETNPHKDSAYEEAGGEIIFTLPNGLHAYMLIDEKGDRIDAGPIDIVADRSLASGTIKVVNGVSCISCHRHGMIDFADQIGSGHALTNQSEIAKIEAIYRPAEVKRQLASDRAAYLRRLEQVIGPYLQVGAQAEAPIESFPEPITTVVKLYQRALTADQVAAELSIEQPAFLSQTIQNQTELISLGLGVLPAGGTVKREHWEARGRNSSESVFQRVSRKFGRIPVTRISID
jgi:serine/threonine-protein kinase